MLMSPRDSFWFLAGALVAIAVLVTVRAWFRDRFDAGEKANFSAATRINLALGFGCAALGLYSLIGSPPSTPPQPLSSDSVMSADDANKLSRFVTPASAKTGSLDEVTHKLAMRLAANGGSDDEWRLLAQSYTYMGRTADAQAALSHRNVADARSAGPIASAAAAVQPVLAGSLAAVANTSRGAAADVRISGTVLIEPRLAARALTGSTHFIYAKQPDVSGPPIAVQRVRADHWPVAFVLSDASAMVVGRSFSSASSVLVEARISRSGEALPRPGDLIGTVTRVDPRAARPVRISIDREID
jgi:hypothetical protein